jgi:TolB-like protein
MRAVCQQTQSSHCVIYSLVYNSLLLAIMKEEAFPDELIRNQLKLILNSPELRNTIVLSRFLEFIVEEKIAGRQDQIKEYTIGSKVFGKFGNFQATDASVRVHAGRLRRILEQYNFSAGKQDPISITMLKGGYIPHFENRLPGGEKPVSSNYLSPNTASTSLAESQEKIKPVLAVLPFHDLNKDQSKEYFVTGLGEQLSIDLAKFENITVLSYFFTDTFGSNIKSAQQLRQSFGVDYILSGSVLFFNEMLRLNMQLVSAGDSKIIWADTYNLKVSAQNIFEIQEEISEQVLNLLADSNGIINKLNFPAGSLFSKRVQTVRNAIHHYYIFTFDYDVTKCGETIDLLEEAVSIEPGNALLAAMLAEVYINLYVTSVKEEPRYLQRGNELVHTAVSIDERCQLAQKVLARILKLAGKKIQSLITVEKCVKLNPKASWFLAGTGLICIRCGEYTKGFSLLRESSNLNPSTPVNALFGFALYYFHEAMYHECIRWLELMDYFDSPFKTLLMLAARGKLSGESPENGISANIKELELNVPSILNRGTLDPSLQKDMVDGLRRLGLAV